MNSNRDGVGEHAIARVRRPRDYGGDVKDRTLSDPARLDVGVVEHIETNSDTSEFLGSVTVNLVSRVGRFRNVPVSWAGIGNGLLMGAMPTIGAQVVIGYMTEARVPFIIAYLPTAFRRQVDAGKFTPVDPIEPGEVILLAPLKTGSNETEALTTPGASIKLKTDGNIDIKTASGGTLNMEAKTIVLDVSQSGDGEVLLGGPDASKKAARIGDPAKVLTSQGPADGAVSLTSFVPTGSGSSKVKVVD